MIAFISAAWLAPLAGTVLFLATMVFSLSRSDALSPPDQVVTNTSTNAEPHTTGRPWDYTNPEMDQLITDLKKEKESLATREAQLQELSQRLQSERSELGQLTQTIQRMQKDFDQSVIRVREDEVANLKKMSRIYAAMSPEGAATIFKEMNDEQVVKILVMLKEDQTAPILESLAREKPPEQMAKRTATISNRLRLASAKPAPDKTKTP